MMPPSPARGPVLQVSFPTPFSLVPTRWPEGSARQMLGSVPVRSWLTVDVAPAARAPLGTHEYADG